MFYMDLTPRISITDFDEMRAHYKGYLMFHNFHENYIEQLLFDFDVARAEEDYDWIFDKMTSIGVELIND